MDTPIYDRHKVVPTLDRTELSESEQAEFPWDIDCSGLYFRYLDTLYCDQEFMRSSENGWDGISTDTFFSATLVKFSEDFETVDCCRVYS